MIALIPDPVHSHLALRFDRAIDAIELAAGSMHYVMDRYWLPWDVETQRDWIDYASFKEEEEHRKMKEHEPGVLIFRWESEPQEMTPTLIYIFLVGETPTAGFDGGQFKKAVSYAKALNRNSEGFGNGRSGRGHTYSRSQVGGTYILGPTSSASLGSLAAFIKGNPNEVEINTTARNPVGIESGILKRFSFFIRGVDNATHELCNVLEADGDIDTGSCQTSGRYAVATLTETSTTLGDLPVPERPVEGVPAEKTDAGVDIFRYPREIASLRNAYGAVNTHSEATSDKPPVPRPSLSVNLTDLANRSDEPPDFSKTQAAPLSQEATLMAFAAEMKRKHYRYIGINASNTLDVVFLARFLRNAVPDARAFSFESDLLLEHEPDNIPYIGTLSVTTYPLLYPPLNQLFERNSPAERMHLPFTSQREEGLYNAAICTVRDMLDAPRLGSLSERATCSPPNPPLWLTVFGAGGHWPVQVLELPGALKVPAPDLTRLSLPATWTAACTLLSVLAIVHILILLGFAQFSPKFQPFRLSTVATPQQLFAIHIASATLALALSLVLSSAWIPNRWTLIPNILIWIPRILVGLLLVPCVSLTIKYAKWRKRDSTKAKPERRLLGPDSPNSKFRWLIARFASIWLVAAAFAFCWWHLHADPHGHYGLFFSFRAANLASIVSPLAPMLPLLAAIYIATIFYVWHLVFSEKIRPRLNPSRQKSIDEDALRPGCRSENLITQAINRVRSKTLWGITILLAWAILFYGSSQFELFERRGFECLYGILFSLLMLLILISGIRLVFIWQMLRKFLLELDRQWVRRVFLQLDNVGWRSLWFYGSEDPDWDSMVRSLEVLQQLWHTPYKPEAAGSVANAIARIRRARRRLQRRDRRLQRNPSRLQRIVSRSLDWIPWKICGVSGKDGKLEKATTYAQNSLAEALNQALDSLQRIWSIPDRIMPGHGIEERNLLEKYVALRWAEFIRAAIARIRLLILFLAIGFSLAMISLVIYSFEPHQELLWSVTALFIGIGILVVTVLIQMHREPILSGIVRTKTGKLDLEFYMQLFAVGIGPVLTLLATYSPTIVRYLVSFLQPGLEALK